VSFLLFLFEFVIFNLPVSFRVWLNNVNCAAVTSDGSILATGSYDTTVMVWEVFRGKTEKRIRNSQSELPRKNYVIVETPSHILCGHDDIITCLYVSRNCAPLKSSATTLKK
jgi:hypothetical protein